MEYDNFHSRRRSEEIVDTYRWTDKRLLHISSSLLLRKKSVARIAVLVFYHLRK